MTHEFDPAVNVAMFAPWHKECGVRDYTEHLVRAMDSLPEIASTRMVAAPEDAARLGAGSIAAHFRGDARRFGELGSAMNAGADIAHIQHQYFLFGGVAPHRTHIRDFLNAIRIPAVMTVHEIAVSDGSWMRRAGVLAANRMNFLHPGLKALVVHTEQDRDRLLAMGVATTKTHLIRHPVPPARQMPTLSAARRVLEPAFPALAGRRIVTLFGFMSAKKGHRVAVRALARMPEDVALLFAGGPHPDDHTQYVPGIQAEIARLGLQDRVVITGYLEEDLVPAVMAATEVALAPFVHTSGSGSLANLFAYGRAIVASDIAPHRELERAAPGAMELAPADDPDRLASLVLALMADDERRAALQHSALAYARSHTYLEMARDTLNIYRALLRG